MDSGKDGGPAFPCDPNAVIYTGISVRDYFAASLLPKLYETLGAEDAATEAYRHADAMLKARQQP